MAYETVTVLDADTTTALGGFNKKLKKDNPVKAEGYYLGSKIVDSPKSKDGKAKLHILQTAKGNLGVWGKTDMDKQLANVVVGAMVEIVHTGMQPTKNGEMYKYRVRQDKSNVIAVESGSASPAEAFGDDEPSFGGDDESEESESYASASDLDEEDARQNAAVSAAEAAARKAKLNALLSKKR